MFYKYFLLLCGWLLHSLDSVFDKQKLLILMKVNLSVFYFMHIFCVHLFQIVLDVLDTFHFHIKFEIILFSFTKESFDVIIIELQ